MCCKAGTVLHILWNAKHFSMSVENNYLAWFEYTDLYVLINPGSWQMCVGYIFARSASSPQRDEVRTEWMLLSMENNVFPLISNIILPKVSTLLYPVQPEMLAVIYWNLYLVLKCYIENNLAYLGYTDLRVVMMIDTHVKQFHFVMNFRKLTLSQPLYCLHWFFSNKYFTFQSLYNEISISLLEERC